MTPTTRGPLRELMERRAALAELALVVLLIGMGVEFVAFGLSTKLALTPGWAIVLGLCLIVGGFCYLLRTLLAHARRTELFEGVFVVDSKTQVPIRIPRYDLSEKLCDFIEAAFSENPALQTQWQADTLGARLGNQTWKSGQLLTEALEYFLLREFSMHVGDFFNLSGRDHSQLTTFEREDVPDVLLRNRFFELFSKKPEERPAFKDDHSTDIKELPPGVKEMKVVLAYAPDGRAMYEHFDLVLPGGSRVTREGNGAILIDAPRMRVRIEGIFEGFGANLPDQFARLSLKRDDPLAIRVFSVSAQVVFEAKTMSVFSAGRFEDYAWVDSFCKHLDATFSSDLFFDRIKWEAALTVAPWLEQGRLTRQ